MLGHRFAENDPDIEQIQDVVEQVLISANHFATARAYIVYREQRARLRSDKKTVVEVETSMNEYLAAGRLARQRQRQPGLLARRADPERLGQGRRELLALARLPAPRSAQAHREGDIHIHDLDMLAGYCAGWSLRTLITEGLNGVPGKVESAPPKHLSSAVGPDRELPRHAAERVGRRAGVLVVRHLHGAVHPPRRLSRYDQVRQSIQELVYNLNVPSRWGTQTPFTNLTFDWTCPDDLAEQRPVIGGVECDFTYGELQREMDMINRAYIEVMTAGDAKGRVFTFPIPTYNITPDFPWESENADLLFEMTAKYGLPYFQNFLNSELKPNMVRSMCCRLQLDLTELLKRGNGLFGSAEQTGSLGVVTINCARLGYSHAGDEAGLLAQLDTLLDLSRTSLEIKRKVIQRHIDDGLFPYTKRYLGTLRNHFSTIGVNGINEMIRNFTSRRTRHHHP